MFYKLADFPARRGRRGIPSTPQGVRRGATPERGLYPRPDRKAFSEEGGVFGGLGIVQRFGLAASRRASKGGPMGSQEGFETAPKAPKRAPREPQESQRPKRAPGRANLEKANICASRQPFKVSSHFGGQGHTPWPLSAAPSRQPAITRRRRYAHSALASGRRACGRRGPIGLCDAGTNVSGYLGL